MNDTTNAPAAACPACGGWTTYGGMSQHSKSTTPVEGRTGCSCNEPKARRLEEVKAKARAVVPEANKDEMAAALLAIIFNPTLNASFSKYEPRLLEQIYHALGPIVPPSDASLNAAGL